MAEPSSLPPAPLPQPPGGIRRLVLHSCCAPCVGGIMEAMLAAGLEPLVLFYNPNIHPAPEYLKRKEENARFADRLGIPFVDADYEPADWMARVKGLEEAPERGPRCTVCFDMRLAFTADHAQAHGYRVFTSSLGISRHKDMAQVNACGRRAAARHPGLVYWDHNWRKGGGIDHMLAVSRREGFYRQDYCGCVFSRRDAGRAPGG